MDKNTPINENNIDKLNISNNAKQKALEKVKQKAVILNIEELADKEARKTADAYMTESKESLKGSKNLLKKIWKHTFFDEYYRQKEVAKVRKEIIDQDNIYVGRDIEKIAHDEAMGAISERFISEYDGTLIDGEEKQILDSKNKEDEKTVNDIKNLIIEYSKGNFTEESFKNEKVRILDEIDQTKNGKSKGHHLYSDNLFEIAQNARIAIEHGAKIDELELDSNIILGKAKSSLKTEAHFNKIDDLVDKMKKSPVGRFVNPATLNTALGLAYSISVGAGAKFLRSGASHFATFGAGVAVSGIFTAMNESQRLKLERAQHGVEMAEGGEFEEGSKKREQMENFAYHMESSNNLTNSLRDLMFEKSKDGKDVLKDIKEKDVEAIMATLANIDARKSLNAKKKIDLISYSNISNVEKESTDLTILTARAKVELRKKLNGEWKNNLPKDIKDFDSYLERQVEVVENSLLGGEKGINEQDKNFNKFKNKEVAKKVATTVTLGLIFGGVAQEVSGFVSDRVGNLVENLRGNLDGATALTPLASLSNWLSGKPNLGEPTSHFIESFKENIVGADEYLNNHLDEVKEVMRDGWYDNDTPKPIFDHNELKLQWGGVAGSAGIENGNYVLDISHMESGGSFHEGLSVDAQEKINNGGLKMIFSLTSGTQDQVFELPIDSNGKVTIDPNSEIGKLFFSTENGNAVFKGRFAEVVETFGEKDGVTHVKTLATLVGEGNNEITDIVHSVTEVTSQTHLDTDLPMYIPIMSRRPLESLKKGDNKKAEGKKVFGGEVVPEVIVNPEVNPDNIVIKDDEITSEEKKFMEDDMRMLNEKVRNSKGIIATNEFEFKSKYGKRRYGELKHIGEGKPIKSFNMFELQIIGNEIENYLVKGVTSNKKESEEIQPKLDIKKDEVVIDDNKEVKTDVSKEKVFTKKDLSYVGTEFETDKYTYKILNIKNLGLFSSKKAVTVMVTSKEDPSKQEILSYNKNNLVLQLEKKVIKITKSGKEE